MIPAVTGTASESTGCYIYTTYQRADGLRYRAKSTPVDKPTIKNSMGKDCIHRNTVEGDIRQNWFQNCFSGEIE